MNKKEIKNSYSIGKIKWDENGNGVDEQGNVYHDLVYRGNNSIKGTIKEYDDSIITINVKATETYKNLQQRIDKATNYYYKTLAEYEKENKQMPEESVMMFNLMEGNK